MAEYVNVEHLKFILHDVHDLEGLLTLPRFKDYDSDSVDLLLDSVKDYSDRDLYPYFTEMDREKPVYKDGTLTCHPQIENVLKHAGTNGFIGAHFDFDEGGTQMPHMVSLTATFISTAANNSATGYIGLTAGAASLIRSFGSKELFQDYVPKMMAGEWGGTMALTEPQAGSSLSDIVTSAKPNGDGSFNIKGQKIFISAGDHQCAENIVHLTLARIEGSPAGTRGISLFVIPKKRVESGQLVGNDVFTAGEFDKMGQKGYVTTHLVFGDKDNCKGWLVGEPNKGLKYMFQMMNGARLEVGLTAASIASAAYHASLQYAKERPQGRRLDDGGSKNLEKEQTLIINHPDVRRMLLLQRSIVEGATSLLVHCGKLLDISRHATDPKEKSKAYDLLEILTPIAKTYPSEFGQVAISNGMQVLGGYGYTTDFPLEQYYRDARICAIYEGTTGIQSLDLLGRKVTMKNGAAMIALLGEINKSIDKAKTYDDLKPYAEVLKERLNLMQKVLKFLMPFALKGQFERYLSDANIFMEMASVIVIAWQWLMMATAARQNLVTGSGRFADAFYEGQIHTMKFYFKYELPKTSGLAETLMHQDVLTIKEKAKETIAFT